MKKPIRVFVVDDHAYVREAIKRAIVEALDIELVGEAECSGSAISPVESLRPDVLTTDLVHPGMDVYKAMKTMRSRVPGLRIVVFTLTASYEDFLIAARLSIEGYVTKELGPAVLVEVIREVCRGNAYFRYRVRWDS